MCQKLSDIPLPNFLHAPKCCACGEALEGIHLEFLPVLARWPLLVWGDDGALAVVCHACYLAGTAPQWAVELRGGAVVYHEVTELQEGVELCVR